MKFIASIAVGALVALAASPALTQSTPVPARGQQVFRQQCAACHSVTPGRHQIGPSLGGLVGRRAGKAAGFTYSPALARASFAWDKARLEGFIAQPARTVPGNRMPYAGLADAGARQALVAYLATVK